MIRSESEGWNTRTANKLPYSVNNFKIGVSFCSAHDRPVNVVVKYTVTGAGGVSSTPGPVRSDTFADDSQPLRYFFKA